MPGFIQSDVQSTTGIRQESGLDTPDIQAPKDGSYRGENVIAMPSDASLIEDAFRDSVEELTHAIEEKEEKDLSKREIEEGTRSDQLERVLKLKEVQEMIENLRDLSEEELQRVLGQLLAMKGATPRQLRERARESLKEPSHQYAALEATVAALRAQGAPQTRIDTAEAALKLLMDEEGPSVRAGINVSRAAASSAGDGVLGDIQSLRDTYRDSVLDYGGLSEVYGELVKKYGGDGLAQATGFLLNALADDMAAHGSSIDRSKLNAVLEDMYRLEVLTGMLENCNNLIAKTKAQGVVSVFKGTDLLKEVLDLQKNKWLSPEPIKELAGKVGVRDVQEEINFLREFKELVRKVPIKAYPDPEQRTRILDAIQLALDDAIDREESGE